MGSQFKALEASPIKNKYFYRTKPWAWFEGENVGIYIENEEKIITNLLDEWWQVVYVNSDGSRAIWEFVYYCASFYSKEKLHPEFDVMLLEAIQYLIDDDLITLSDIPVTLDDKILNPLTEESIVDMLGLWEGSYTYNLTDEYMEQAKLQEVRFTINITEVKGDKFVGTVEDNQDDRGTPGVGKIEGVYDSGSLKFKKNMPISSQFDGTGGWIRDENKAHPTLFYNGSFALNKKFIKGGWRFKKRLIWSGFIPRYVHTLTGKFTMFKVE
jgi:hypothetical protein